MKYMEDMKEDALSLLLLLASFAVLVTGCAPASWSERQRGDEKGPDAVAWVNGEPILREELDRECYRRSYTSRWKGEPGTCGGTGERAILDEMVTERVLYQEVVRQGLPHPPEVQREMGMLLKRREIPPSGHACQDFRDNHIDDFLRAHPNPIKIEEVRLAWLMFYSRDGFPPHVPNKSTEYEAQSVRAALWARPERFAEVAIELEAAGRASYGEDTLHTSSIHDGWLNAPWIGPGQLTPVHYFGGDGGYGYRFAKVLDRREDLTPRTRNVRMSVLRSLKTQCQRERMAQYEREYMQKYSIVRIPGVLASHSPPTSAPVLPPGEPDLELK